MAFVALTEEDVQKMTPSGLTDKRHELTNFLDQAKAMVSKLESSLDLVSAELKRRAEERDRG